MSAGGLVSALMSVRSFRTVWVGWPGVYVDEGDPARASLTSALGAEGYAPVYLDPKTVDLHYNGFCNSVLWQVRRKRGGGGEREEREELLRAEEKKKNEKKKKSHFFIISLFHKKLF